MLETDSIEVQPTAELRKAFAQWATATDIRVRTVSLYSFSVPYDLFGQVPEALLVGAHIDGHLYRHVEDEGPLPDLTESTYAKDSVPLETHHPVEAYAYSEDDADADDPFGRPGLENPCPDCDDSFRTAVGLKRHRTWKHSEELT